jgi:replicative DNA helicase
MVDNSTPHSEDTTVTQLTVSLEHANKLLSSIEGMQNTLANAKRRRDGGLEADLAKALETAQKALLDIERQVSSFPGRRGASEVVDVSGQQLIDDYWEHIARRKEAMSTGFGPLNTLLGGGLEPQRLVVLLGAPGGGKTTFVNQVAEHIADTGRPVFYVTSEDTPFTLLAKTIARRGQLNYTVVLKGYQDQRDQINAAMQEYRQSVSAERLHYLDASGGLDSATIREKARAHFERYKDAGQGILIVDYLQRIARAQSTYRAGNQDLRQAVTVLTEDLRGLAVELDCCVIALASQRRQGGYGATSGALSSAKESGDIEYTADIVMVLDDDESRLPGVSWLRAKALKIEKNRQGDSGDQARIQLDWYPERQQFTEASKEDDMPFASSSNGRKRGRV